MSSRKGGRSRGTPAHQNKVAWVPNRNAKKNETEPGSKQRPLGAICAVCPRCRDQIAWRRKYGKYKMLTEPAKCASCTRRNVKDSYHAICRECAAAQNVCAKCRKPAPTIVEDDLAKEQAELAQLEQALKTMRERDRRTLLREMAKPNANRAELIAHAAAKGEEGSDGDDDDDEWNSSTDDSEDDHDSRGAVEKGGKGAEDSAAGHKSACSLTETGDSGTDEGDTDDEGEADS